MSQYNKEFKASFFLPKILPLGTNYPKWKEKVADCLFWRVKHKEWANSDINTQQAGDKMFFSIVIHRVKKPY